MKNIAIPIFLVVLTCFSLSGCNPAKKQSERPNILFIMSDDHAYQAVSAYGHGLNETPNIDRIAREGARFSNAFVTNSICAPSRAVLLTGIFSHLNGKIDNFKPYNWDQQNFAKILQQSGYETAMIGKIHLSGEPQGFDYWNVLPGQGFYYNPEFIEMGEQKQFTGYVTTLITQFTLKWLNEIRDRSKPFCLLYHHKAPHRNWMPEEKYLDLYEDQEFDTPANFFDDYSTRGKAAREQTMRIAEDMMWGHDLKFENDPYTGEPSNISRRTDRMNEEQLRAWWDAYTPRNEEFIRDKPEGKELAKWKFQRYMRDYLKCVKSIDDGVGEILDYLDKEGLAENTVVIYTSDQGFFLGEHGWYDKRFMYEESLRIPLLIRYPEEIKAGSVVDQLIQNLDFAPTFLDYAGVDIPGNMQGESFRNMVSGEPCDGRDAIYYHFYEYPSVHMAKRHYGVRTDRYKLMHFYYDVDEWELYDLKTDPSEMLNVYDDPAYAEVQEMMHRRLVELREKYNDKPENDSIFLNEYLEWRRSR